MPPRERATVLPGRLLLRFGLLVIILGIGFFLLRLPVVREHLELEVATTTLARLRHHPATAPVFVVTAGLLTAVGLPGSVPLLLGGLVFGAALGGLLGFAGNLTGAALSWLLCHSLARELVTHLLGRHKLALERLVEKHGFWTLVRLRFVPIPFAVTNYGASLAGTPFSMYMASSALALLPVSFIYSYFAATLASAAGAERAGVVRNLVLAVLLLLALSFLPTRIMARRRREPTTPETEPSPPREDRS